MEINQMIKTAVLFLLTAMLASCSLSDQFKQPPSAAQPLTSSTKDSLAEAVDSPSRPVVTDDGRMLRPEGHEGIWYETEPDGLWAKYVWRSQQFVGNPVELPPLGDSFDSSLRGIPDYCDDSVKDRLAAIGFSTYHRRDNSAASMCTFTETPSADKPGFRYELDIWTFANIPPFFTDRRPSDGSQVSKDAESYRWETSVNDTKCMVSLPYDSSPATFVSHMDRDVDYFHTGSCLQTLQTAQIIRNIT